MFFCPVGLAPTCLYAMLEENHGHCKREITWPVGLWIFLWGIDLIKFIDVWRPILVLGGTIPGQGILDWVRGRKQASWAVGHIHCCFLTVDQCGHLLQALAALTSFCHHGLYLELSWNKCFLPWVAFFRVFHHSNKENKDRFTSCIAIKILLSWLSKDYLSRKYEKL